MCERILAGQRYKAPRPKLLHGWACNLHKLIKEKKLLDPVVISWRAPMITMLLAGQRAWTWWGGMVLCILGGMTCQANVTRPTHYFLPCSDYQFKNC